MAATTKPARRTTTKTSKPVTPATWDFQKFLGGFRSLVFPAQLIQRVDLAPLLADQLTVLEDLDARIDRLEASEGEDTERDITAVDPLAELSARRERLTHEYNDMAQEYNDSAVHFVFRVPDKKEDHERITALMDGTGITQPDTPTPVKTDDAEADAAANAENTARFEREFAEWWGTLAIRSMAVTCIKHPGTEFGAPPLTVPEWEELRDTVGAVAFAALSNAWFKGVQAVSPSAPFSPRPLPSRTQGTPSPESGPPSE